MKTKVFKTVEDLIEFVKEFEKKWSNNSLYSDKELKINYCKLIVELKTKQKNRTVGQESDKYIGKELGSIDSITDMKRAENIQHPSETKWMLRIPTMLQTVKGE